jgi:hypothetical protein
MTNHKAICPSIAAKIAIEALKGGDIKTIAEKYEILPHLVSLYQHFLEENAAEVFLPYYNGKTVYRMLKDMQEQLKLLEESLIDACTTIGICSGDYFSE